MHLNNNDKVVNNRLIQVMTKNTRRNGSTTNFRLSNRNNTIPNTRLIMHSLLSLKIS